MDEDRKAKADAQFQEQLDKAAARFEAAQALDELKRRRPEADWRTDPPCPDCGSMEHFEC